MGSQRSAEVDRYLAAQPPDIAHILEQLRETVHEAVPGTVESLAYGMPVFLKGGRHIFYVGAWKKHAGLYPIYPQEAALEAEIAPLRSGKDGVKLVYARPIPYALVARLAQAIAGRIETTDS
jgi:uncharacterized protein YdhG (YjbR/CyaY superfamily)